MHCPTLHQPLHMFCPRVVILAIIKRADLTLDIASAFDDTYLPFLASRSKYDANIYQAPKMLLLGRHSAQMVLLETNVVLTTQET